MFDKLKKAHEVLSDPHQRAIYDCLGKKGLEEKGWEIVQRVKTPREIRDEYEALARWVSTKRNDQILHVSVPPQGQRREAQAATDEPHVSRADDHQLHRPFRAVPLRRGVRRRFRCQLRAALFRDHGVNIRPNGQLVSALAQSDQISSLSASSRECPSTRTIVYTNLQ